MSCNAWNHPPNCNCGWGGVFHRLGLASGSHHWQKYESYTNPNANCPQCRARVFYYESPYGGKVYFDHMGPPWTKHPCMDTHVQGTPHSKVTSRKIGVSFISQPKPQQIKVEDGWIPVYCFEIHALDRLPEYLDFALFDLENRKHLYAKTPRHLVDSRSPILIRRIKDQLNYEISTLNVREVKPTEIRLFAFTTIKEAEAHEASLKEHNNESKETTASKLIRVIRRVPVETAKREVLRLTKKSETSKVKQVSLSTHKQEGQKNQTSNRSTLASQKKSDRSRKREERELASKENTRFKTAFEIAFDIAKDNKN